MSEIKLGKLIKGEQQRDAIHVAIVPMKSSEMLRPGQRVGLIGDSEAGPSENCIGIVDPYLTDVVPKGETFWLCLLPDTVTGMRHHWEHPSFDCEPVRSQSEVQKHAEEWLRDQCGELGMTFSELTDPNSELFNGDYVTSGYGESARDHWFDIQEEFWKQYEIYTGSLVPEVKRGGFSCCSC